MAWHDSGMGATFTPGGSDDFYMPASPGGVIAPTPQKPRPDPQQIQTSFQHLDLNGRSSSGPNVMSPSSIYSPSNYSSTPSSSNTIYPIPHNHRPQTSLGSNSSGIPKLPFRTPNIPESDEEREMRLERDRQPVLDSQNFEDQLGWAQDALSFVDSTLEQEQRLAILHGPRPSTPPIEQRLRADAMNIVDHMATQRHPRALFMKGMWLEFGKFARSEDRKEAFRLYKVAAANGFSRAEYRMGMLFESTNEPNQALQHYRAGETAGDSASCYRMGMIAALGQLGQPQDFGRAISLIRYAADYCDDNAPQGAFVYGMLQARDLPQLKIPDVYLARDIDSGRTYIERAAFLGFSKAQLKMGAAYELCALNCEFNPALSLHYNALAARQGEPEAELAISKWFICGHDGVFQKNEEVAFNYAQRAAQQRLPTAEFAMGYFYEIGWYKPKDFSIAQEWYQKAARNGNKEANDGLQRLSNSQTLSMRDHEKVTMPRIKSTHGSKRGQRPPRLTKPANQMPTVPDEGSIPPQNRLNTDHQHQDQSQPHNSMPPRVGTAEPHPPRASSIAPYPMEERSATVAPVGPYPGGHELRRPQPVGYYDPDRRASSEAVDPRSNTVSPPRGRPCPSSGPPMRGPSPIRPYQSATDVHPSRAAVNPQRHPIGPSNAGYGGPPGAPPPMRPPKDPINGPPHAIPHPTASPSPPPPRPGISRPVLNSRPSYEFQGSRRSASPSAYLSQSTNSYGPGPTRLNPDSRPPSRPSSGPASSARPTASDLTSKPQNSYPPRLGARPGQSSSSTHVPSTRPPGKGPKTFEEMGVPISKNDGECTIM